MADKGSDRLQWENLRAGDTWIRGLYMLLFALIYGIAELLVLALAVFQFASVLLSRRPNQRLLAFAPGLAAFIREIVLFWTYATEAKPYPFAPWPKEPAPQPAGEPAPKPAPEPAGESVSESAGESAGESASEPAGEPAPGPAGEPGDDPEPPSPSGRGGRRRPRPGGGP